MKLPHAVQHWRRGELAQRSKSVCNDNLFRLAPESMAAISADTQPSEDESKTNEAFAGFLDSVSVLTV